MTRITAALLALLAIPALLAADAQPFDTPLGKADASYTVTAEGKNIPVKAFWKNRIRMARLAISGKTRIAIAVDGNKPIAGYEVRPKWAKVTSEIDGNQLVLTVAEPCNLRVKINKNGALALFTYPMPKKPTGKNVVDASKLEGIDTTGKTDMVGVFQQAVDTLHKDGGGTLYVPNGTYGGSKNSTLRLKSNVNMHLAPEAIIKSIRFLAEDANNIRLTGEGILDFTGSPGTNQAGCLRTNNVDKLHIEGLISTNFDYNWNTRFDFSTNVTVRNYKVFGGKDGIDPVNCRKVHISDVYIVTVDDCIATKSFQSHWKETSDITAEYCLLQCLKYGGVKIGTETNGQAFKDITYRNIEIVSCMRAAIIQLRDGAEIHNVTIENLTCGLGWARAIDFVIQKRRGLGSIHDVTVRNVNILNVGTRQAPRMEGFDEKHKIHDVTFEGLHLDGQPIRDAKASGFTMKHTEDIVFKAGKNDRRCIKGLADKVTSRSDEWKSSSDGGLKAILDGDPSTTGGVRNRDRAAFELDLGKEQDLLGIRINGRGRGNALGVSLFAEIEGQWKRLVDHCLVDGDGGTEALFEKVTARKLRVELHGMPGNNNVSLGEFMLFEPAGK
ncbi:MAG: discoidin domain-containing protein [Phycisphaerae bacterium]